MTMYVSHDDCMQEFISYYKPLEPSEHFLSIAQILELL